jgi:maleylpyruvate isomerase
LVRLVTNATTGSSTPMYASPEAREADIDAGAGRQLDEQIADLESSAARFADGAAALTEENADVQLEARNQTKVRAGFLPFMRLREVVFHHVDLDAGFGFGDVEDELVLRFLEDAVRRLRANAEAPSMTIRTGEGDEWSFGDGAPTVSGSRVAVLGWLTRGLTDGVTGQLPTLPFGG